MYKCADCGNTEKFIGFAEEYGKVLIYKNDFDSSSEPYTWIYNISEENWSSNLKFVKCSACRSENIVKI